MRRSPGRLMVPLRPRQRAHLLPTPVPDPQAKPDAGRRQQQWSPSTFRRKSAHEAAPVSCPRKPQDDSNAIRGIAQVADPVPGREWICGLRWRPLRGTRDRPVVALPRYELRAGSMSAAVTPSR